VRGGLEGADELRVVGDLGPQRLEHEVAVDAGQPRGMHGAVEPGAEPLAEAVAA
jgi:hypothetical protein